MMEHGIKAVLWDMDGVLIDSEPHYNVSVGEMARSLGFDYGAGEIAKVTGSSYKNIAEILGLDMPQAELQRLYIDALMRAVTENVTGLIDGVPEFLDLLKGCGVKMAIGSSSPRELVEFIVQKCGLSQWMDVMITGSDAENGKPAPDIYLKCAERLGVTPTECLVIEDSRNGILAGKNAGMFVCAFTGTKIHAFDLSDADFEISSYAPEETGKFVRLLARQENDARSNAARVRHQR
ncbi:MAG: HAD family phosphatase [Peptococcaceae bacterium]|jgi:HAD superfamily hydrolase (TIGR01509 family)|nr:HAD family phosphatase [Peptococcaceae bacterium]